MHRRDHEWVNLLCNVQLVGLSRKVFPLMVAHCIQIRAEKREQVLRKCTKEKWSKDWEAQREQGRWKAKAEQQRVPEGKVNTGSPIWEVWLGVSTWSRTFLGTQPVILVFSRIDLSTPAQAPLVHRFCIFPALPAQPTSTSQAGTGSRPLSSNPRQPTVFKLAF